LKPYLYAFFFVFLTVHGLLGQNKTKSPSTYEPLCFFTINQANFPKFIQLKEAIENEDYASVFLAIKKMRTQLKKFKPEAFDRGFELWYIGNYSDFKAQANVAKASTLNLLKHYENRLRMDNALYYEHRHFLELYLSYTTEAFYPEYWFMSQERYLSKKTVQRIQNDNTMGADLFDYASFYDDFLPLNDLSEKEQQATSDYLDLEKEVAQKTSFIPYSFLQISPKNAQYLLDTFTWNDSSLDIDVNREIRAFQQFLQAAKAQQIHLVARFNLLQLRQLKKMQQTESND
jgi:hypothetical protein